MTGERYMREAIALALKAKGRTSPNPMVGAVFVKNGQILGRGYHARAGAPHAEICVLQAVGGEARGGTLYINLEPCCHWGRTPPCTQALVRSGIQRVIVGMVDPNPLVAGKGIEELRRAGIEVEIGLLEEEARRINEAFIKYVTTGRPFVILKTAVSLDGKIATASRQSRWITGARSRQEVHRLRAQVDAILVGIETILADDPQLTVRLKGGPWKNPKRVIVDSALRLPLGARVLHPSEPETLVVATPRAPSEKADFLREKGAQVLIVPEREGRVDLSILMEELGRREVTSLLIEGGGEVNAAALQARLVDKVVFFIAPLLIGGKGAPGAIGGEGIPALEEAVRLERVKVKRLDPDIMVQGYVVRQSQ